MMYELSHSQVESANKRYKLVSELRALPEKKSFG